MHPSIAAACRLVLPVLTSIAIAACGASTTTSGAPGSSGAPTAVPASTAPTSAPAASPAPATPTAVPLPPGMLAWPTEFQAELTTDRYFASPPFVLPLSLEIDEAGWRAGHTNPVFTDIQRYDGVPLDGLPTLMFGFAWPETFQGGDGPVPVEGLTPEAAFDALAERASIEVGERAPITVAGIDGTRVDLHSDVGNNPTFGSDEGNFGLQPELDLRLTALPYDGRLLLVMVLAPPDELDAAWERVQPILESVALVE